MSAREAAKVAYAAHFADIFDGGIITFWPIFLPRQPGRKQQTCKWQQVQNWTTLVSQSSVFFWSERHAHM